MFCAISGEVPVDPVISTISGHIYERSLVEKYIREAGKCPVTGKELTEDNLLAVQVNKAVKPRPINATSIPGLLATFQNEWDEVMLETFTLKQHLDTTRQELSQALYQHDAACRVIARLMKERDEARAALASIQAAGVSVVAATNGNGNGHAEESSGAAMETDQQEQPNSLSAQVVAVINDKCKELSVRRKGRKPVPEGDLAREKMASLAPVESSTPHKASAGGVTCMAVSRHHDGAFILTGGADKDGLLTARAGGRVLGKLTGHSKKVTGVAFHPTAADVMFTCSADKTVKVWKSPVDIATASSVISFDKSANLSQHSADVSAITVHPTGDFVVSVSLDQTWAFWDVNTATCLRQVTGDNSFSCGQFHPDGLILATGSVSGGSVKVWDVRESGQNQVATFDEHGGSIHDISFSENGYLVATACEDGQLRTWDLRKLKCSKTLSLDSPVTAVSFDSSGLYIAAAAGTGTGQGVHVFNVKDWTSVTTLANAHTKTVTALSWGPTSTFLASASLDRVVKVYAPQI